MRFSIDWLSVSYADSSFLGGVQRDTLPGFIHKLTGLNDTWLATNPRKPFTLAYKGLNSHVVIYGYLRNFGILVECGGRAIDYLETNHSTLVDTWLTLGKITRIDIACDYERRIAPSELCKNVNARTLGTFVSSTGETYYIGSQKSDKFIRCYLYNEPHERANSTRVEFVYRREYALKIARELASGNIDAVIGNIKRELIGREFSMSDDWDIVDSAKLVLGEQNSRDEQKTLLWLRKQVAPSVKRLLLNGVSQDTILSNIFPFLYDDDNQEGTSDNA